LRLTIYSDGASRNNPGESAVAFIVLNEDGRTLKRYYKRVGIMTNNQAEYEALILALESASELTDEEVVCCMDSELAVKQLRGTYKVRDPELKNLWSRVQKLKNKFRNIDFVHVKRTDAHIEEVHRLASKALDKA